MFAIERTCCCAFPTVRGALKITIFQILAKRCQTSYWFSIVAKQHQEPRPALPPGAVSLKTGPLWEYKSWCVVCVNVSCYGCKHSSLFMSTNQLLPRIRNWQLLFHKLVRNPSLGMSSKPRIRCFSPLQLISDAPCFHCNHRSFICRTLLHYYAGIIQSPPCQGTMRSELWMSR